MTVGDDKTIKTWTYTTEGVTSDVPFDSIVTKVNNLDKFNIQNDYVLHQSLYTVIPRKLAVQNSQNSQTRGFCYLATETPQIDSSIIKLDS